MLSSCVVRREYIGQTMVTDQGEAEAARGWARGGLGMSALRVIVLADGGTLQNRHGKLAENSWQAPLNRQRL
jgi:hypothetical protein